MENDDLDTNISTKQSMNAWRQGKFLLAKRRAAQSQATFDIF